MDKKILIIDDEVDILDLLSYNFEKTGFNVATATNGIEALKKFKEFNPDVIISDIMMPEMNGIELSKKIKNTSSFNDQPFVFLTASSDELLMIDALQTGASLYITKPIGIPFLINRIKHMIN